MTKFPVRKGLDNLDNLASEYNSVRETLAIAESEKEAFASANHELSIKLDKAKLVISRFLKDENEAKEEKGLKKELLEMKIKL